VLSFVFSVIACSLIILIVLAMLPRSGPTYVEPTQVVELTPYEMLKRQTYISALKGNKSSRDWVLKNMSSEIGAPQDSFCSALSTPSIPKTPKKEIDDSIAALVGLGYKKKDAKDKVLQLTNNKEYKTCQQIIMDAMKR